MSCQLSILKVLLSILNTLLSVLGIALIALSVFELNNSKPGTIEHITIVIQIFIGSFIVLTSFLGCFGVCRESLGLIWSFGICLLILLAFQIYTIIVSHSTDYGGNATSNLHSLWSNDTLNAEIFDEIEQQYNCCGLNGSQDYTTHGKSIPKSCYADLERKAEKVFRNGCLNVVENDAIRGGQTGILVKWIIFLVEILTLACTGLMAMTLRNNYRRHQYGN